MVSCYNGSFLKIFFSIRGNQNSIVIPQRFNFILKKSELCIKDLAPLGGFLQPEETVLFIKNCHYD